MTDLIPTTLVRDKDMARDFLAGLDPRAHKFTFQFFSDGQGEHAEILHGTLDEVWPKVQTLNTPERGFGVFVTINETDFKGRRTENIVRPRALFADADSDEQITTCMAAIEACGATPSMIVDSGRGRHFYYVCPDIPIDRFSALQKSLIDKFGTDPAVKDLPRVMRLPGTLHLKDPTKPRPVKLFPTDRSEPWKISDLIDKLKLSLAVPTTGPASDKVVPFKRPKQLAQVSDSKRACESLADGLETDIQELRSAVLAIPPSAISTEPEWMRLARALAWEANIYPQRAETLWEILDLASRGAPGYDEEDNRKRFERYISEARGRKNPITINTVFHMANQHGWKGTSQFTTATTSSDFGATGASTNAVANGASSNIVQTPATPARAVAIADLPLIPKKREWLHGIDLMRGAVSMLVAPGARSKTTWLITTALACASGRPLQAAHVYGTLRVLYLSAEDSTNEMALRVRAAMKHHALSDPDVSGLHVIGAERWGLHLLRANGGAPAIDQGGWDALIAELDRILPDVLIIDPLINILGGVNVNENSAAALLMGRFVELAVKRHIAVIIAHHAAKGRDPASAESAMGAASFTNLARIALAIEPLAEKDAGQIGLPPWEAKFCFRILGTKMNFSAPGADDRWYRIVSIDMENQQPPIYMTGDQVAVVEPFRPGTSAPTFPEQLISDALQAIDAATPPLSTSKNSKERYAAPVIAQAIAPHRGGRASDIEGKAVLEHIIRAELVRVEPVKIPRPGGRSDDRNGLVLTPAGKVVVRQVQHQDANNPPPATPAISRSVIAGLQGNAGRAPPKAPRNA
jgi:AAA domain/RepB DNA-primase N-terminal domain/Primase C terminal 2 (PriCT-2)